MLGRTNISGGGGAGLNFKVVGNPQPSNPKANTIWVNTDVDITGWYFSATQPENLTEGDVWFPTGTSSSVEFNSLKKNGIQVYPLFVKQYVGGALVDKTAKVYQSGKWATNCGLAGYQPVEYLQNTSAQYIDTGIVADYDTEVDCEVAFSSVPTDSQYFGVMESSNRLYVGYSTNSGFYHGYGEFYVPSSKVTTSANKWNEIHLETAQGSQKLIANSTVVKTTSVTLSKSFSIPYYLFAVNRDNAAQICPNTKIAKFQLRTNGVLVRDFVPCYRKSDSVAGMWDNVSETFFENAGTGTFIVGADV